MSGTDPDAPSSEAGAARVSVVNAPERLRYELRLGADVIGFAQYRLVGRRVVFIHTEVDQHHSGQGFAAQLAKFALDDVRAAGKRIVPVCPYIAEYVRKHREYDDSVDPPTG